MASFIPAKTGSSRVFIIEGRARPDHKPAYQSAMKASSPSQSFGDIEKIEIPSSSEYGKFTEIGSIRGAVERVSITLEGRYAADLKSDVLRMARAGCAIDIQINIGSCTNPSDYNTFTKKVIIESAFLTNWQADDLGALGSDEQAGVNESVDVSGRDIYEIVQLSWAEKAASIVTNEVVDVALCDTPSCGDCETESAGCSAFYAITLAAGGSPGTPADVVYTLDDGTTWYADDINSLTGSPSAIACMGSYLVVVSEADGTIEYALKSALDGTTLGDDWTSVTTGFVGAGGPRDISVAPDNSIAFIVGTGGYIYSTQDPTSSVTVLDAGVLFPLGQFNAVHAFSEEFAVAVGAAAIIAKTENGTTWSAVTTPLGVGVDFNTVLVRSKSVWLVGASDGNFYYTLDGGVTWTTGSFPGSGTGTVLDIVAAGETVVYMAHQTAATLGRILRSSNGGYDWVVVPEGTGTLVANDKINAIAACASNPDVAVGVGLADNGSDGFIVLGSA